MRDSLTKMKMPRVFGWMLAAIAFVALAPLSAASDTARKNIRFQRITPEHGLSQATVNASIQGRDGLMWFGTQEGLNRYDGRQFTVFSHDPGTPSSLSQDFIRSIAQDREGFLWIGTDARGLNRFNPVKDTAERFRHDPADPLSIGSDRVRVVIEDRAGTIWIGTDGGGLNRFDRETGSFGRFTHNPSSSDGLGSNHVRDLWEDRQGMIWVGMDDAGLSMLNPGTGRFTHYRHDPEDPTTLSDDHVRVVYEDRAGFIWVGSDKGGLSRLNRATGAFERFRHDPDDLSSLSSDGVRAILQDREGSLWIGTDSGLNEWRPESQSFHRYRHEPRNPHSLTHDRVSSIYEDRGGVLWVGTYGGLNKWNTTTGFFRHYKRRGDERGQLSNNYVTSFAEGLDRTLWVGTFGGGLNRFDRDTSSFAHYRHDSQEPGSLSDDRVMSLYVDGAGVLWVGTRASGLNRFDSSTETFVRFRHDPADPSSLSGDGVTSVLEDPNGSLWVGVYRGGLNRLDRASGKFARYRHDPSNPASLSSDRVFALFVDHSGILWIGTDGGGLNRFDPQTQVFRTYRHDPEDPRTLSSDHIQAITEDNHGDLWISTHGGGICRWRTADRAAGRAVFERYIKSSGLPSGVVYGVLQDLQGKLWLSSNRGLSSFELATEVFKNFDISHGLQSYKFNFGSFLRTREGELFFGGINGFNAFYPDEIRANSHVPPVVLTAVLKSNEAVRFDQPVSEVESIELRPKDYVITFDFAALDYTAPTKNRYMYKLQGLERHWVDLGTRTRASYTNLRPGEYTFRVKGSNNDGVWNELGAAIGVTVLPPAWQTWWAKLGYLLASAGALLVLARAQTRKHSHARELDRTNETLRSEIADRQSKERALEKQKKTAQTYLDVAEVAMVALDDQGEVTLINQKGCRVLGYREDEIVGKKWLDSFVPESVRGEVESRLRNFKAHEYYECPVVTSTGEERIIAWHTAVLPPNEGAPAGTLSSGIDVTQERELESQVRRTQKMDAIGTLAGGIAHDFNNLLSAILGYTTLARGHLAEDDEASRYLENVTQAGEDAKALVRQILTFSRRGDQARKPILVQDLVDEALGLLRPSLPSTVEVRKRIDASCRPVLADPCQIQQVLMNLATNAYQAMGETEGTLEISLAMVDVDAAMNERYPKLAEGPHVRLSVSDTGCGMSTATIERIFDPFFTTKEVGEGTGLGLSVVHGILEKSGGEIVVSSRLGEGTTVEIYLPCCEDDIVTETTAQVVELEGTERILIVDDEEIIALMAEKMLENLGYSVLSCHSSAKALEMLRREPQSFDLLVSDLAMPGMTGLQLARRVREFLPELPVVLMAAFGDKTLADSAVSSFLRKPFEPEEIGSVVREALNRDPTKDAAPHDGAKASPSTDETQAPALRLSSGR